jgi:hypothetical protein
MIFNRIVTALRAPLVETAYGKKRDWDHAESVYSGPASLQYRSTDDIRPIDDEAALERATLYMHHGDFQKEDRVEVDGNVWEIEGIPFSRSLFRVRYTKVYVRRVIS